MNTLAMSSLECPESDEKHPGPGRSLLGSTTTRGKHFTKTRTIQPKSGRGIWVIEHRLTKSHGAQDTLCGAGFQAVHSASAFYERATGWD